MASHPTLQFPSLPVGKESWTTPCQFLKEITSQEISPALGSLTPSGQFGMTKDTTGTSSILDYCCGLTTNIWKYDSLLPQSESKFPLTRWEFLESVRDVWTINFGHIGPNELSSTEPRSSALTPSSFKRKPWGICINPRNEQIYVADRDHHQILLFSPDGDFLRFIGQAGDLPGQLNRPTGLACDPQGDRLYVTDKDHHRIQVFSDEGKFLFGFGSRGKLAGQLYYPWGIAVSPDGAHVAVADPGNRRVQLYTSEGMLLSQFCNSRRKPNWGEKSTIHTPRGVAFDQSGKLIYMTDFQQNCVFRLDPESPWEKERIIDGRDIRRPSGIEVDSSGHLIICEASKAVKVFRPDGVLLKELNTNNGGEGRLFDDPLDVALHPAGFLSVLDSNGRLSMI